MVKNRKARSLTSVLLALLLFLSSWSTAWSANLGTNDADDFTLLHDTDFEDGDTWGFVPGAGATATVETDDDGNRYLLATGSGNGGRTISKMLPEPTGDAEVLITFDWRPGEVSTGANSSEILFRDTENNPLFRLVKAGGPNGSIRYGVGTTGTDLSQTGLVSGISTDGSWLSVELAFDFRAETIRLTIFDRDDDTKRFVSPDLDLGAIHYVNRIGSMAINGNRASGNTLNFETGLDNVRIYGSGEPAPDQGVQDIVSIVTPYDTELRVPLGLAKDDVIAYLPASLDVLLANGVTITVPVRWESAEYRSDQTGTYPFTGTLVLDGVPNLANSLGIEALVWVTVAESGSIPPIEGFEPAAYTDFGDTVAVVPPNWGFTTSNATLSINTEDIGGNTTPKLQFTMVNQTGGRVATKTLDTPVKGGKILLTFDWYPGKVNDKGNHANENAGEFVLTDSSNNTVFTLNNTNNAPLAFFAGGQVRSETRFTNPLTWYDVEILFDLFTNTIELTLTEQASGLKETHVTPLDGVAFDGTIASIKLAGVRTSGNNITWTTVLDNFGIYYAELPANTITRVDRLPYHRVYVNETTEDIASIDLPESVTVTLADDRKVQVGIAEWSVVGKPWNPAESGVYEFRGVLAESDEAVNSLNKSATLYVYNRLSPSNTARQAEWLDRGVVALNSGDGIFISWRLRADEYDQEVCFNVYRNGQKLNHFPLWVSNFTDPDGAPGDRYSVETLVRGVSVDISHTTALATDYLSIPLQVPEGGTTATGPYTYSANDASVGDLDGDGVYEIVIKWDPSNSIDSASNGMTGPTIFDAYKLDGTLLWRINMGLNLTSGAHYHQFLVADFNGDGKSEFLIKTADGTTVYGATNGVYDPSKVISVIGNPEDNGRWVNENGHVYGGPEYISIFDGATGQVIDTIDYAFPVGDVASWGDTWYNRSDRFLAAVAYLDGVKPSAVYGRGYYERTTFVAYDLIGDKLHEVWTFDSSVVGRGGGLGNHNLATADVDNDGFDEIVAGSLTLDHDGTILYAMDGQMGRDVGSHGDAMHVGAFDPDREGLQKFGVHEVPAVASLHYYDAATGETLQAYSANKDTGRGLAANIISLPGYEFWGTGGDDAASGGGINNVQIGAIAERFRDAGLSVNFALYWDGDLLHELLDQTSITKYNEQTGRAELVVNFPGVVSNNGTKATPSLQADILGDWREEVVFPTADSTALRIFSTTIPTEYRLFTLMHDPVYRNGIAWQNTAYNQPPHISFYLGEDIRDRVLAGHLQAPNVIYTWEPVTLESLKASLDHYIGTGQISGPMVHQLTNRLNQVEHHWSRSRLDQAAKHLSDFVKQLNNRALIRYVDEEARISLKTDALQLISLLEELALYH